MAKEQDLKVIKRTMKGYADKYGERYGEIVQCFVRVLDEYPDVVEYMNGLSPYKRKKVLDRLIGNIQWRIDHGCS